MRYPKIMVLLIITLNKVGAGPFGIVDNMLDCNIMASKLQSGYYIHLLTPNIEKSMNLLIPSYGLNIIATVFLQGWLWY